MLNSEQDGIRPSLTNRFIILPLDRSKKCHGTMSLRCIMFLSTKLIISVWLSGQWHQCSVPSKKGIANSMPSGARWVMEMNTLGGLSDVGSEVYSELSDGCRFFRRCQKPRFLIWNFPSSNCVIAIKALLWARSVHSPLHASVKRLLVHLSFLSSSILWKSELAWVPVFFLR